jgi:hypothetical protein
MVDRRNIILISYLCDINNSFRSFLIDKRWFTLQSFFNKLVDVPIRIDVGKVSQTQIYDAEAVGTHTPI